MKSKDGYQEDISEVTKCTEKVRYILLMNILFCITKIYQKKLMKLIRKDVIKKLRKIIRKDVIKKAKKINKKR